MRLIQAGVANGCSQDPRSWASPSAASSVGRRELFALGRPQPCTSSCARRRTPTSAGARRHPPARRDQRRDRGRPDGPGQRRAASGRYVGAVGGAVDFLRGADARRVASRSSRCPRPSAGAAGSSPRSSGPVSTPRSEGVVVVTEHGVADLRGATLSQRIERMIAVADPLHRSISTPTPTACWRRPRRNTMGDLRRRARSSPRSGPPSETFGGTLRPLRAEDLAAAVITRAGRAHGRRPGAHRGRGRSRSPTRTPRRPASGAGRRCTPGSRSRCPASRSTAAAAAVCRRSSPRR